MSDREETLAVGGCQWLLQTRGINRQTFLSLDFCVAAFRKYSIDFFIVENISCHFFLSLFISQSNLRKRYYSFIRPKCLKLWNPVFPWTALFLKLTLSFPLWSCILPSTANEFVAPLPVSDEGFPSFLPCWPRHKSTMTSSTAMRGKWRVVSRIHLPFPFTSLLFNFSFRPFNCHF